MATNWKWEKDDRERLIYLSDEHGCEILCARPGGGGQPSLMCAPEHARLIAAAPQTAEQRDELLAACKALTNVLYAGARRHSGYTSDKDKAYRRGIAAIAKIEKGQGDAQE